MADNYLVVSKPTLTGGKKYHGNARNIVSSQCDLPMPRREASAHAIKQRGRGRHYEAEMARLKS